LVIGTSVLSPDHELNVLVVSSVAEANSFKPNDSFTGLKVDFLPEIIGVREDFRL